MVEPWMDLTEWLGHILRRYYNDKKSPLRMGSWCVSIRQAWFSRPPVQTRIFRGCPGLQYSDYCYIKAYEDVQVISIDNRYNLYPALFRRLFINGKLDPSHVLIGCYPKESWIGSSSDDTSTWVLKYRCRTGAKSWSARPSPRYFTQTEDYYSLDLLRLTSYAKIYSKLVSSLYSSVTKAQNPGGVEGKYGMRVYRHLRHASFSRQDRVSDRPLIYYGAMEATGFTFL